jgi:AraC-like DNA-binding protein
MIPTLIRDIIPSAFLEEYVRKYQVFRFMFHKEIIPPIKHHYPRPEHSITFYINDKQNYEDTNLTIKPYPSCVINGIYTVPVHRHAGHDFLAIKVVLQPSTLYQLLRFPITILTNNFLDAESIWGNDVAMLCDRLKQEDDLDKMIICIESFLTIKMKKIHINFTPIDTASNWLLQQENNVSIDWLASQSCLSKRQFIRNFEKRIGVSAKTFERIVRFDKAYRLKNLHPQYDWLYIAIACGYHDYQHMVKDFKSLTELTPSSLSNLELQAPERHFGFSYLS